jgi:S-phase kinase-associated protein 1
VPPRPNFTKQPCGDLEIFSISIHSQLRLDFRRLKLTFIEIFQISKEGESHPVRLDVAKMSKLVEATIDDEADEDIPPDVPLPNVKSSVLAKVIEYCEHYKVDKMTDITTPLKSSKIEDLVQSWYSDFVKVDQVMLFELVTAANFMDIKPLLDLTCLAVSIMIKVGLYLIGGKMYIIYCCGSNAVLTEIDYRGKVPRNFVGYSTLVVNLALKRKISCVKRTSGASSQATPRIFY